MIRPSISFGTIIAFSVGLAANAQTLDDPYYDTGLSDRIVGFANPETSWDLETWTPNLAEFILQNPGELNSIYSRMIGDFEEVYRTHGLNTSPDSDGGRFQALQLAINERVDRHNQTIETVGDWTVGIGVVGGVAVGSVMGWVGFRRPSLRNRLAVGVITFALVGGGCGAILGNLANSIWKSPYPRFDRNNPVLAEQWKQLDQLSNR